MVSARNRDRVERVRRVREIQAELALADLRVARAEVRAVAAARSDAETELGAWDAASSASVAAGLFGVRRAGLSTQARVVARLGDDLADAAETEQVRHHEWSLRARRVEGLDRLIDRIAEDETRDELAKERVVLEEFSITAAHRRGQGDAR